MHFSYFAKPDSTKQFKHSKHSESAAFIAVIAIKSAIAIVKELDSEMPASIFESEAFIASIVVIEFVVEVFDFPRHLKLIIASNRDQLGPVEEIAPIVCAVVPHVEA